MGRGMDRYSGTAIEPEELELRLGSGRCSLSPAPYSANSSGSGNMDSSRLDDQRRQISIFYDGRVCVFNTTDFQAKAIIDMAKNEVERSVEKDRNGQRVGDNEFQPQLLNPAGLSMKRSLQRFLQKRKARMADRSFPYGCRKPLQLFSS